MAVVQVFIVTGLVASFVLVPINRYHPAISVLSHNEPVPALISRVLSLILVYEKHWLGSIHDVVVVEGVADIAVVDSVVVVVIHFVSMSNV